MKNRLLHAFFVSVITSVSASAQPVIQSQKTIGGKLDDNFYTMACTKDGGYVVGGSSKSGISGEKTESNRGIDPTTPDYWLVKLNRAGEIEWDKTIGGSDWDELLSVQQTRDGGYILGGNSSSPKSGEKTQNSRRGSLDYWVVKLDSSGNIEWDRTFGGFDEDLLSRVKQTRDGGYILGGRSLSNASGEKTENGRGDYDFWIVKIDRKGNKQWDKTIGGDDFEFFTCLDQTSDGGYIVGGTSSSGMSGDKTEASRGRDDCWIIKLDMNGNIEKDKTIGGSKDDELNDLQQTADGGYILGASSFSNISGEKSQRSRGGYDYWIVKLDKEWNKRWDRAIGGDLNDFMRDIVQTEDRGYALCGYSVSNASGEKTEPSRGVDDYWFVKVDSRGNFQWDKTIGGADHDFAGGVLSVSNNKFIIGGYSYSGISGDKTEPSRGGTDFWVVTVKNKVVKATSGISNNVISLKAPATQFSIYPNPVKDVIHIKANGINHFALYDESGKMLLSKWIRKEGEMNVSNLPAGTYYLKNNSTTDVQKIIIIK